VFKGIKDLTRIFFKPYTEELHDTVLNKKFNITMLDAVTFFLTLFFLIVWIDYLQYLNSIMIMFIAIEVAKIFRINSYMLGVKVMLFNLILDVFWSFSASLIYPNYINLSHYSRASTGIFTLHIPNFSDE
jgi:hypothetical protein